MAESADGRPVARTLDNTLDTQLRIVLGMEIHPTKGAQREAEFAFGQAVTPGDPLKGFQAETTLDSSLSPLVRQEGNLFLTRIIPKLLAGRALRVRARKSNVVTAVAGDKSAGMRVTAFAQEPYPTEEEVARVHIFLGQQNITEDAATFDQLREEMKSSQASLPHILIRLDDRGERLLDCIVDNVVTWKDGVRKVRTGR